MNGVPFCILENNEKKLFRNFFGGNCWKTLMPNLNTKMSLHYSDHDFKMHNLTTQSDASVSKGIISRYR